jgi:hypothetical protein
MKKLDTFEDQAKSLLEEYKNPCTIFAILMCNQCQAVLLLSSALRKAMIAIQYAEEDTSDPYYSTVLKKMEEMLNG